MGYKEEDLLGKSALKFIHPEDLSMIAKKLFEGFKHGKGSGEFRFRHKDGHWLWLEGSGQRFSDSIGNMKAIIISRDITKRKIADEKLKESEEKYRHLYENSPFSIVLLDYEGKVLDMNTKTTELFGYEKGDRIGKNY